MTDPTTPTEAVAAVIHAAGFHAMAREYLLEPAKRDRVVIAMTRNIRRDLGADKAAEFNRLARLAARPE